MSHPCDNTWMTLKQISVHRAVDHALAVGNQHTRKGRCVRERKKSLGRT